MPAPPAILMPERLDAGGGRFPDGIFGSETARPAAVLVLITPASDDADAAAEVILIRRTDRGGHHSGDIALPGGRIEPDDADAAAAALREAEEEVTLNVSGAGVRVIGELESFWIPVSDYRITPILAIAARRPELVASLDEVEAIVRVPLAAFLPDAVIEVVETEIRGFRLRFGAYSTTGLRVWGATARILGQLGAIVGQD